MLYPSVWPLLQGLEALHFVLWRKGASNGSCSEEAEELQQLVMAAYKGERVAEGFCSPELSALGCKQMYPIVCWDITQTGACPNCGMFR